jgi:hypothetical protein
VAKSLYIRGNKNMKKLLIALLAAFAVTAHAADTTPPAKPAIKLAKKKAKKESTTKSSTKSSKAKVTKK